MENLKLLFQLYFRPLSAMSDLMDRGSWLAAALLVLVIGGAFYFTVNTKLYFAYHLPSHSEMFTANDLSLELSDEQYAKIERDYQEALKNRLVIPVVGDRFFWFSSFEPSGFYRPLISIVVFYVPIAILLVSIFGQLGSFGVNLQKDYGTLSICTMMAWSAAHLPFAIAGILLNSVAIDPQIYLIFWLASGLLFGVFMLFALRVVFGVNYGAAIATVALAWIGFSIGIYVFKIISPFLFSPFLLIMAYMYFGGAISSGAGGLSGTFRQRQNFKRFLQNATVNPHDADAHVQLGLIYNQRRQTDKALEHFTRAKEIDKDEPDANYELGRISRHRGELQEALNYFSVVVGQNDKYSLSENLAGDRSNLSRCRNARRSPQCSGNIRRTPPGGFGRFVLSGKGFEVSRQN